MDHKDKCLEAHNGTKKKKIKKAKLHPVRRRLHASKAVLKAAGRRQLGRIKQLPKTAAKTGIRMAGGIALGALAGGAGVAIGAATGDIGNVAKIGAGSAVSGFAVGSGAINNIKMDSEYKEAYKQAMNSKDYKEEAMKDYVKKYLKDPNNKAFFEEKLGAKEAKEMFKSGEIEQYLYNNITDRAEMAAIHKLVSNKVVKDVDAGIGVSQLGTMIGGDSNNLTSKKRAEWKNRIGDMAEESGIKDKEKFAEDRLREIDKLNDFKK